MFSRLLAPPRLRTGLGLIQNRQRAWEWKPKPLLSRNTT
jgi:hypothetical protein